MSRWTAGRPANDSSTVLPGTHTCDWFARENSRSQAGHRQRVTRPWSHSVMHDILSSKLGWIVDNSARVNHARRVDLILTFAGFGVGVVVGLTGMGGGALMTPLLVLAFGVPPLAAVSSDLAASAVMKPFGGWVHARRGTVNWSLVRWLCLGSVPSAFCGVLLARLLPEGAQVQHAIQVALAVALVLAAAGMIAKVY